jgi:endogenous inhibitor of DNA gyrase (YacG/DUF329 family)
MKIHKKCLYCDKPFITEPKYIRRGHGKFCSPRCAGLSRPRKIHELNLTCAQCATPFYRQPSHFVNSKSGVFFCSRKCKDKAQQIDGMKEIHPSHYNGKYVYRKRMLRSKAHKCVACGYRKSVEVLLVHHIDWSRQNNEPNNLAIVCPTCHKEIHLGIRNKEFPFSYGGPSGGRTLTSGLQDRRAPVITKSP